MSGWMYEFKGQRGAKKVDRKREGAGATRALGLTELSRELERCVHQGETETLLKYSKTRLFL